jgi:hypothetical protein
LAPQVFAWNPLENLERLGQSVAEQPRGLVVVRVRTRLGLGHDGIDHAELETVRRVRLERRRRLPGLPASRQRIAAQPSGEITV